MKYEQQNDRKFYNCVQKAPRNNAGSYAGGRQPGYGHYHSYAFLSVLRQC